MVIGTQFRKTKMLADLLKIITPEALAAAIKSNPAVVQIALQKFEAYNSFGEALTIDQQICISNNLHKLNDFFKSTQGKSALGIIAEEFQRYVKT